MYLQGPERANPPDALTWQRLMEDPGQWLARAFEWLTSSGADWGLFLAAGVGLFVLLRFLRAVLAGFLKTSEKSSTRARNVIGKLIAGANSLFLLVISFSIAAGLFLDLDEHSERWLGIVVMVMTILQFAFWARILASALIEGAVSRHAQDASTLDSARNLISLFANIAIFALAAILILDNIGADVTGLIAGLGVGGIAIALAAQTIFKDLFASLSIILDKPFVRGDFIIWQNDFMGTVDRIGLKTTRIKSLSGEQLIVGNDDLLSGEIRNYKRMAERRIVFRVGVLYQTPRPALEAIPGRIRQIVEKRERCRFDRCHLANYADSSIEFETVYYVLSPDYAIYMDEQQEIYLDVHRLFEELDVEFAYPTRTVFLEGGEQVGTAATTGPQT
jgi:small-conductance mechanosensitive channel